MNYPWKGVISKETYLHWDIHSYSYSETLKKCEKFTKPMTCMSNLHNTFLQTLLSKGIHFICLHFPGLNTWILNSCPTAFVNCLQFDKTNWKYHNCHTSHVYALKAFKLLNSSSKNVTGLHVLYPSDIKTNFTIQCI